MKIKIIVGVILAVVLIWAWLYFSGKPAPQTNTQNANQPSGSSSSGGQPPRQTNPSIQITDIVVGTGAEAKYGDLVRVNYLGTLTDGTKFDSSYDRGVPFEFTLGAGQVITGWDEGVSGMKVGGKRHLVIPPDLAYGDKGAPPKIPPNAILVFDIELLSVSSSGN